MTTLVGGETLIWQHQVPQLCQAPGTNESSFSTSTRSFSVAKWKVSLWQKLSPPSFVTERVQVEKRFWPCLQIRRQLRKCVAFPTCPVGILCPASCWRSKPALNAGQRRWRGCPWPTAWKSQPTASQPGVPQQSESAPTPSLTFIKKGSTQWCITSLFEELNKKTYIKGWFTRSKVPTARLSTMRFKEYIPIAWNFFLNSSLVRNTEETWLLAVEIPPNMHTVC